MGFFYIVFISLMRLILFSYLNCSFIQTIFLYIFEYILTAALKLLYVNSKIWTILRLFYIDFFPDLEQIFSLLPVEKHFE